MTFIIAEAGVNHNGSVEQAVRLIDAAKIAGADAVKFQAFSAKKLQRPEIAWLELSADDFYDLHAHANATGIEFMCTAFDTEWLVFVDALVNRHKIASGCLENWALLDAAGATGKPIIMSTGMSDYRRIARAEERLGDDVSLLHCVSAYPCPPELANLRAIKSLHGAFPWCRTGYSDHTIGITVPIAAVAMGATIIEKHLTLDRSSDGPDHKASIEPATFRLMVTAIRTVEQALGDGVKALQPCEVDTAKVWYAHH